MEKQTEKPKLKKLLDSGYENTGKTFKIMRGEHKGKKLPVYAMEGDYAALVYNPETDKIEFVYKLPLPHKKR